MKTLQQRIYDHQLWLISNGGAGARFAAHRNEDLANSCFQGAALRNADFRYADLQNANFEGADLFLATFRGADLSNAKFRSANLRYTNFADANLEGTGVAMYCLHWICIQQPGHLTVGCQRHTYEEWANFTDDQINVMHSKALKFWSAYKEFLLDCKL